MTLSKPFLTSIAAAAVLACGAANAQTTLRLATAAPKGTVWQTQLDRFAADVAAETQGSVKVEVFYSSQLGSEADALAQVARGRIDMISAGSAAVGLQMPAAFVPGMFMYYDSAAQRECILDKHLAAPYAELIGKKGLHFLGWLELGNTQLAGKKPLTNPAELKGMKFGINFNKLSAGFWQLYGVVPVATPPAELSTSLGTGLVDAAPSIATFYVGAGLNKIAPVWSILNYSMSPAVLAMSKSVHDKLSADQRQGMARAVAKVPASQLRSEVAAFEAAVLKKHVEGGGKIVEASAADLAEWRKPMPAFYKSAVKEIGPDAEALFAKMDAAKKACGS